MSGIEIYYINIYFIGLIFNMCKIFELFTLYIMFINHRIIVYISYGYINHRHTYSIVILKHLKLIVSFFKTAIFFFFYL